MRAEGILEEIRARLDIVDVISEYVELRRSGQNYKGLCPFHSEKTPSFMVSPDKQIFHCFGCGVGGSSVNFIMKYENLSFHEALRFLAKKAGIRMKEFSSRGDEGPKEKLLGILRAASAMFAENLKRSKRAYSYLTDRGLTDETISAFSLGYAVKDWHFLSNALKGRGIPDDLILQAGIASSGEKGLYDIFRDRIMFAISNMEGEIIAFGGRVMDEGQPKYLNSPDTPLFKKGVTLYGLDLAKEGIRGMGYAMIVEGYFDVIVCHQYGFRNAVAPLGTALTAGHLSRLRRFTRKAVLVFDGDEAGKSAAKRAVPLLLEQGFESKILLLPEKDDPDSFLRRNGSVPFSAKLGKSRSVIDFLMSISRNDKTATIREALGIVSSAKDAIMKEELIRELSERTGVRETVLREEIRKTDKVRKEKTDGGQSLPGISGAFSYDEEILLLSAAISFPDRLDSILGKVAPGEFRNRTVGGLFVKLGAGKGGIDSMMPLLSDEEKTLVTRLTVHPGFDQEAVDRNIEDCVKRIETRKFEERRRHLHERIREAEGAGDRQTIDSLLSERQKLMKEAR